MPQPAGLIPQEKEFQCQRSLPVSMETPENLEEEGKKRNTPQPEMSAQSAGGDPEKGRKGIVLHGSSWPESRPWTDVQWNRRLTVGQ